MGQSATKTRRAQAAHSEADMEPWRRQPLGIAASLGRAFLATLVLGLGIGIAIGVAELGAKAFGWPALARQLCQAILVTAIVVPTLLTLRHRLDQRTWASLGWRRPGVRPYLLGAGVAIGTGIVTWGLAAVLGWISFTSIDPTQLFIFLVTNVIVATLFEALPEEVAMRGYAWTNLRDALGSVVAAVVSMVLFLMVPALSNVGKMLVQLPAGGSTSVTLFPAGDPVAYVVQLAVFALVLIAARTIHLRGALFAAVAFHTWHLVVNRVVLGGLGWMGTGVDVKLVNPDAAFLVLINLFLAAGAFWAVRQRFLRASRRPRASAHRKRA